MHIKISPLIIYFRHVSVYVCTCVHIFTRKYTYIHIKLLYVIASFSHTVMSSTQFCCAFSIIPSWLGQQHQVVYIHVYIYIWTICYVSVYFWLCTSSMGSRICWFRACPFTHSTEFVPGASTNSALCDFYLNSLCGKKEYENQLTSIFLNRTPRHSPPPRSLLINWIDIPSMLQLACPFHPRSPPHHHRHSIAQSTSAFAEHPVPCPLPQPSLRAHPHARPSQ